MMHITPIGRIETPFEHLEDMPIQPKGAKETMAKLILEPKYAEGLKDLEGFSHIYLVYYFHKAVRSELSVIPFMDTQERGVFATRSPLRPSHIGLSLTSLVSINDNIVTVRGVDVLDGTPLLDIKPYIPQFENIDDVKTGWMNKDTQDVEQTRSDDRFI